MKAHLYLLQEPELMMVVIRQNNVSVTYDVSSHLT